LVRILLAAAITALTRGGADAGGISIPLSNSRAFGVGVHMSTSAGVMPPPPQLADAPAGARSAKAVAAAAVASPALSFFVFESKPISFVGRRG
jgi:hypothetical protein